jgi:hypothetical protein
MKAAGEAAVAEATSATQAAVEQQQQQAQSAPAALNASKAQVAAAAQEGVAKEAARQFAARAIAPQQEPEVRFLKEELKAELKPDTGGVKTVVADATEAGVTALISAAPRARHASFTSSSMSAAEQAALANSAAAAEEQKQAQQAQEGETHVAAMSFANKKTIGSKGRVGKSSKADANAMVPAGGDYGYTPAEAEGEKDADAEANSKWARAKKQLREEERKELRGAVKAKALEAAQRNQHLVAQASAAKAHEDLARRKLAKDQSDKAWADKVALDVATTGAEAMATAKKWVDGRVEVARRMKDDLPSHASLGGAPAVVDHNQDRLHHLKEQTRELLAKAQDRQGLKDFDAARAAEARPATATPAAAASAPAAESAAAATAAVPALANATSLASMESGAAAPEGLTNATAPSAHGVGSHVQAGTTSADDNNPSPTLP